VTATVKPEICFANFLLKQHIFKQGHKKGRVMQSHIYHSAYCGFANIRLNSKVVAHKRK